MPYHLPMNRLAHIPPAATPIISLPNSKGQLEYTLTAVIDRFFMLFLKLHTENKE
jgi:hypothetical protein